MLPPAGRVGRCATCSAFTYDADELSEEELRRLVLQTEGRVLTSLVKRTDGRVMSIDCGHGTIRTARRSSSPKVVVLVGAAVALVVGARVLWPRPVMNEQQDQVVDGVELPTPVPPEPVAPIVEVPPPAVQPMLLMASAPEVKPLQAPTSSGAVRVDVHLSEVNHGWNKQAVQTNQVVEILEGQLDSVRSCYRTTLETASGYRGLLSVRLFVEGNGHVSRVSTPLTPAKSLDDALARCVEASLKDFEFPSWGKGQVSFKLVFAGAL